MELSKLEKECPYLTACVKESLRRDPLVPGPNPRIVPAEGAVINGWELPGNTIIFAQTQTTNHDPKIFPNPTLYIPERWLGEKEMAEMRAMMTTFGSGPRTCIGENLAMMELHCVTALLFRNYNVSIPDGYDNEYVEFWITRPRGEDVFLRIEPRGV
ncbi:cytochrome P450 [Choiromyces venosus 120613-1]|uniref:Cytochrome P450 n=1 Tax=Choiromyces venosus 120613-1 TaxID=1336337 RepID=A0A3N4JBS0_9PEZI|nr:cytochrome P450 [Choiromyces venosus 120613-1]